MRAEDEKKKLENEYQQIETMFSAHEAEKNRRGYHSLPTAPSDRPPPDPAGTTTGKPSRKYAPTVGVHILLLRYKTCWKISCTRATEYSATYFATLHPTAPQRALRNPDATWC